MSKLKSHALLSSGGVCVCEREVQDRRGQMDPVKVSIDRVLSSGSSPAVREHREGGKGELHLFERQTSNICVRITKLTQR